MASHHFPEAVRTALETAVSQNQRTVLLTCGSSGAGKSTFAHSIVTQYPNFTRLSIDAYIFQNHGVYGRDYPEEKYEELQDEARAWVRSRLGEIVGEGKKDVVLDLSFWNKGDRERWREMIERGGRGRYKVVLVVFRGREEVIWERIQAREGRWREEGMGEGRPVSRELLAQFLRGFEWPDGEGEIVIDAV